MNRNINELLQVVLNQINERFINEDQLPPEEWNEEDDDGGTNGICALLMDLKWDGIINTHEFHWLSDYINKHGKPKWYNPLQLWRYIFVYIWSGYYWPKGVWHPRIKWLEKQITLTNH